MADISFNIACKELKIAQIAQLNQLFQFLHLVHIQLFPERLSEKVHATISKGTVGSFEFTVLQWNLKEQCQEQCIDHIPYYLSGLSREHFSDNLSRSSCIRPGLLWVKSYADEEHSLRKRRFSRIILNPESFETDACTINCGQTKRRFSEKGYARTSHARPDFAHNQAERREIDNNTSEHSPIIKTCYQICLFDDLLWMLKTMWKC